MADDTLNSIPEIRPTIRVRLDECRPNSWNPNEQTDETFALLVESIREVGFIDPLQVTPIQEGNLKWEIIGGEHRWSAARVVGMTEADAVVLPDFEADKKKLLTVRLNLLSGKVNPVKFARLFNDLAKKYQDKAVLQKLMGLATEAEFKKIYREVKAKLPEEFAKKLAETKEEVKTIGDLSLVLNRLFAEYGSTLEQNFMFFSFGGREHLMVRCSTPLWNMLKQMAEEAHAEKRDANVVLAEVLLRGLRERERAEMSASDASRVSADVLDPAPLAALLNPVLA